MTLQIPTIDISTGLDSAQVVSQIKSACENWGFFQIVGHSLDKQLRQQLFSAAEQFFNQPLEHKLKISRTENNFWGFYDRELTKNVRDLKEIYDIDANLTNHALSSPDMPVPWPEYLQAFKPLILSWQEQCEALSLQLLGSVYLALGQPAESLAKDFGAAHTSFLRLNFYPAGSASASADEIQASNPLGINRHTDAGAITLLVQDDVPALQVMHNDNWCTVSPEPGAVIVNIGDMVQVWSNDRFIAPEHRVLASSDKPRLSAPYFFNPSYSSQIAPLPDRAQPPGYKLFSWNDFRHGRAAGDYADKGQEIQIDWFRI